jgi:hypothetical protein
LSIRVAASEVANSAVSHIDRRIKKSHLRVVLDSVSDPSPEVHYSALNGLLNIMKENLKDGFRGPRLFLYIELMKSIVDTLKSFIQKRPGFYQGGTLKEQCIRVIIHNKLSVQNLLEDLKDEIASYQDLQELAKSALDYAFECLALSTILDDDTTMDHIVSFIVLLY